MSLTITGDPELRIRDEVIEAYLDYFAARSGPQFGADVRDLLRNLGAGHDRPRDGN